MNGYQSIATINAPEFINLQPLDINPMMSKCEIKVLYLGANRNGTSINKQAATEMAKTLRGAPIVGYYRKDTEDFFDHGDQVIMDGEGVHFNTLTKPYGFVAPDAQVWFQEFEEFNENGESNVRTYLMTTGYLWTGQFEEAQQLFNEGGKPQSMELDENSLRGFWSKDENSNMEFFIINDAIFSKLCILGDDVEPCFEGASITAPNISKNFTLDDSFKQTLFDMMKELQYTLQGGKDKVADEIKKKSADSAEVIEEETTVEEPVVETPKTEEPVVETPQTETPAPETPAPETPTTDQGESQGDSGESNGESGDGSNGGEGSADYTKKDDEDKEEKSEDDNKEEDKSEDDTKEDKDDDKNKEDKYALLLVQFEELQASFTALQAEADQYKAELASMKEYTSKVEDEKKDALIAEFTMLSEEDKKDVIEHKSEYSLDEIKSKLAVLCFDKKVDYTAQENITVDIVPVDSDMPEWLQAVERYSNN